MSTTMKAAIHLGPNYIEILEVYRNTNFEELQNLFDITQRFILEHGAEILNVSTIEWTSPSWTALLGTGKPVANCQTVMKAMPQQLQSDLCDAAATDHPEHRIPLPKPDTLAVDADGEPQPEWKAEDDVKGGPLDPHEVKAARQKEIQYLWDREEYEYFIEAESKTRAGRTQLASNGSIPTNVAPKPHVTVHVWCARRCAIKGSNRSSRQHLPWKLYGFYSESRPDHLWPELWIKLGRNAKLKERHKWSDEGPKLDNARRLRGIYFIDPEDTEFKETIKNALKNLETSIALAMPCKIMKKNCGSGASNKIITRLACILEESTRMRMEDSPPNHHEDHIAGKEDNSLQHHNLVHKFIPLPQAMKIPAAKAAVDKK